MISSTLSIDSLATDEDSDVIDVARVHERYPDASLSPIFEPSDSEVEADPPSPHTKSPDIVIETEVPCISISSDVRKMAAETEESLVRSESLLGAVENTRTDESFENLPQESRRVESPTNACRDLQVAFQSSFSRIHTLLQTTLMCSSHGCALRSNLII